MLKWIRNYYVGEDVKNPGRARARIIVGTFVPGVYVVTLSDNPGNILEILSTAELMQASVRAICPPVVGLANGRDGAIRMVQEIVEEVYRETGDLKIREYLENR